MVAVFWLDVVEKGWGGASTQQRLFVAGTLSTRATRWKTGKDEKGRWHAAVFCGTWCCPKKRAMLKRHSFKFILPFFYADQSFLSLVLQVFPLVDGEQRARRK